MAVPTTREGFKEYCLRALGKPVLDINVSDDQVEDRVDQALRYYYDYHFDGTSKTFYKKEIDQQVIDTATIEMPENIIGVVKLFEFGSPSTSSHDLFNIRYQIALNDLYTLTSVGLTSYYMTMEHLSLVEELLVGKTPIRYNRHRNILHIDKDMANFALGEYLLVEAYEVVDPEIYTDVWSDWWLQRYTTQLIKKQWGSNLMKFEGMQLPGGLQFSGRQLYEDANNEIEKMEEQMINNFSMPVADMIG